MSGRGKGRPGERAIAPPTPSVFSALAAEVMHPGNLKLGFHASVFFLSIYVFREVGRFATVVV